MSRNTIVLHVQVFPYIQMNIELQVAQSQRGSCYTDTKKLGMNGYSFLLLNLN